MRRMALDGLLVSWSVCEDACVRLSARVFAPESRLSATECL